MVWSSLHDEMLSREIMVVDPFTVTKKSTARGKKWEEVAENLNQIEAVYLKVDNRAVGDSYNLLAREEISELKKENKASGIETDMNSIEVALEEFSVLFLYSCILMPLLQAEKKNSYGNSGFLEKVSSYSKINSSSPITTV